MLKALTLLATTFVISSAAQASYVQADLPSPSTSVELGTHIVIAGRGLGAGKAWMAAAHSQALAFADRPNHGPIHMIATLAPDKIEDYVATLQKWGYRNIRIRDTDFTGNELVARLSEPMLIASIDYIGHNGAFLGLALESDSASHRFYLEHAKRLAGKARFSKDAYIRLMGCNTGWYLAPLMAKVLGVPVRGTLTSADVQLIYHTETTAPTWYYDTDGHQPKNAVVTKKNSLTYSETVSCPSGGGCLRLKPENGSYSGHHGSYAGTLSFPKYFCGSVERRDCLRRMALSMQSAVSVSSMPLSSASAEISSLENFAAVVADEFCPNATNAERAKACREAVVGHLLGSSKLPRTFTTLSSKYPQLSCDLKGCSFEVRRNDQGQKILFSTVEGATSTMVDELDALREGYSLLKN